MLMLLFALAGCTGRLAVQDGSRLDTAPPAAVDRDGDGWAEDVDCDDFDPGTWPGAPERCDGRDQDCDGVVDDDAEDAGSWYVDRDGDGFGDQASATRSCSQPSGTISTGGDCDDSDASIHPGAVEVCDEQDADEDCNGVADDADPGATGQAEWLDDADGDGWGDSAGAVTLACDGEQGQVTTAGDCDDSDPLVNPGATEQCGNGVDDDCDGSAGGCDLSGELDLSEAGAWLEGLDPGDRAGATVAAAGDTDGDGLADLLVAAPYASSSGVNYAGAAYLFLGPVGGGLTMADAEAGIEGDRYGMLGYAAAGVGDLDGDGFGDLLVGAPYRGGDAGSFAGEADLFAGPVSGALSPKDATARLRGSGTYGEAGMAVGGGLDADGDGDPDLMVLSYEAGSTRGAVRLLDGAQNGEVDLASAAWLELTGGAPGNVGPAATMSGDVDGDGIADLLAGLQRGYVGAGALLLLGGGSGVVAASDADAILEAEHGADDAGRSVAIVGDTDGDGLDDVAVGAPRSSRAGSYAGAVYVLRSPLTGTVGLGSADLVAEGSTTTGYAGSSVSGAGDADGDGLEDVVVGAWYADGEEARAGAAFIVPASSGGTVDLGSAWSRLLGDLPNRAAGYGVADAGDTDGDGFDDLLVGAPAVYGTGGMLGGAWLVAGGGI